MLCPIAEYPACGGIIELVDDQSADGIGVSLKAKLCCCHILCIFTALVEISRNDTIFHHIFHPPCVKHKQQQQQGWSLNKYQRHDWNFSSFDYFTMVHGGFQ